MEQMFFGRGGQDEKNLDGTEQSRTKYLRTLRKFCSRIGLMKVFLDMKLTLSLSPKISFVMTKFFFIFQLYIDTKITVFVYFFSLPELNGVYPSELFCCAQEVLRFWPSEPKNPSEPP